GVWTATRAARSSVSATMLESTRLMVSLTRSAGTAASAPARTAATTRWNSTGDANGRAASWTTTISASAGTAARPARTDSERVAPPTTTERGRFEAVPSGTAAAAAAAGTTTTTPSHAAVIDATDQSSTRR